MTKKEPKDRTPVLVSAIHAEMGDVLERLGQLQSTAEETRRAALNPRPVEVRHVHEQPPKPLSVQVNIVGTNGHTMTLTLMAGSGFDIPGHLTAPVADPPRRGWPWRRRPALRPTAPVRLEVVSFR